MAAMLGTNHGRDQSNHKPRLLATRSGQQYSEEEKRKRLRDAGRRKLEEFKRRQLLELHRDENGRYGGLFSMAAPFVAESDSDLGDPMGSPMSKSHSRGLSTAMSDWSDISAAQPLNGMPAIPAPAAELSTPAATAAPQVADQAKPITPVFRPIRAPVAAATDGGAAGAAAAQPADGPTVADAADGQDNPLVTMLLQQVSQLQAEKQAIQRRNNELELENANLQELVGFLSENADDQEGGAWGELEPTPGDLDEEYHVIQLPDPAAPAEAEEAGFQAAQPQPDIKHRPDMQDAVGAAA